MLWTDLFLLWNRISHISLYLLPVNLFYPTHAPGSDCIYQKRSQQFIHALLTSYTTYFNCLPHPSESDILELSHFPFYKPEHHKSSAYNDSSKLFSPFWSSRPFRSRAFTSACAAVTLFETRVPMWRVLSLICCLLNNFIYVSSLSFSISVPVNYNFSNLSRNAT